MDFINHREGDNDLISIRFPPFSFTEAVRGYVSLKKYEFQCKAVEVTVNNKEENRKTFVCIFGKEFGLRRRLY
jgi:hypothetical protein